MEPSSSNKPPTPPRSPAKAEPLHGSYPSATQEPLQSVQGTSGTGRKHNSIAVSKRTSSKIGWVVCDLLPLESSEGVTPTLPTIDLGARPKEPTLCGKRTFLSPQGGSFPLMEQSYPTWTVVSFDKNMERDAFVSPRGVDFCHDEISEAEGWTSVSLSSS